MAKKKGVMRRVDKNRWPGVYCREYENRKHEGKPDLCYYITFKVDGKKVWEKVGLKSEQYSPEIAADIRAQRVRSKRHGGDVKTNKELRKDRKIRNRTIGEIKTMYFESDRGKKLKGRVTDLNRYDKHLKSLLARKRIPDLSRLDVERIKKTMVGSSTATKSNALELLRRIINYGAKHNYCPRLSFTIELPHKDNLVTEYLTPAQIAKFNDVLDSWAAQDVARMLRLAMFAGLRRGEIFKLEDHDLDYPQNLIELRDPKGGRTATVPMSGPVKQLLKDQQKWRDKKFPDSALLFPGKKGKQRTDSSAVKRIKEKAGLPVKFRIFHGLRHHFAVSLANNGVSLDMIGELLTHKNPQITRRYAKFLPDTKRQAAGIAAELINDQVAAGQAENKKRRAAK
jgi:integrase